MRRKKFKKNSLNNVPEQDSGEVKMTDSEIKTEAEAEAKAEDETLNYDTGNEPATAAADGEQDKRKPGHHRPPHRVNAQPREPLPGGLFGDEDGSC